MMEEMEKAEAIAAMPQNDQAPLPQNGNVSGMSNVIIRERESCKSTIFWHENEQKNLLSHAHDYFMYVQL